MIRVSDAFRARYPQARLGSLSLTGVANPVAHPELDIRKAALEQELRARYAAFDRGRLKLLPVLRAYDAYYRRFDKSYHVLLQLESVALKGKPIPAVAALVEAMFMAELSSLILTAGHDASSVAEPLLLDVATGAETYLGIGGKEVGCTAWDMMISDAKGVISSVLHGPDLRTRITAGTTSVLFTAYAPEGVGDEALRTHLREIEEYVRLIAPQAAATGLEIV